VSDERFRFEMDPPGHWHVFWAKPLRFTVSDRATGQIANPSTVRAVVTRAEDGMSVELAAEQQVDGSYITPPFTPALLTPHAVALVVEDGAAKETSSPWAIEIARDGEEGIRAEASGSVFVYQIRFDWSPGPIIASADDPAVLTFELMRGIQEGDSIQWEQPWLNRFEHVGNAADPSVIIENAHGTRESIEAVYNGMGTYVARRNFLPQEVVQESAFSIWFAFRDPYNDARVTNAEPYALTVESSTG
jgi:hypothetical protein